MLHLIPAPLHRTLYRMADKARRRWWRIRKPRRRSVNVVAFDRHGHVLLVRHSYGRPVWALPGGAIGKHEDPVAGAMREIREELDCELMDVIALEACEVDVHGSSDLQHVFAATLAGNPQPDMREVVALDFFDPAALPPGCSRLVPGRVAQAVRSRAATGSE